MLTVTLCPDAILTVDGVKIGLTVELVDPFELTTLMASVLHCPPVWQTVILVLPRLFAVMMTLDPLMYPVAIEGLVFVER